MIGKPIHSAITLGLLGSMLCFFSGFWLMDQYAYLFLLPIALIATYVCILKPHLTLLIIVALIPLDTFAYIADLGASLSLFKILTPLMGIGYLRLLLTNKAPAPSFSTVEKFLIVYVLYTILLIPFAEHLSPALTFGRKILSLLALYFLTVQLCEIGGKTFRKQLINILIFSAAISAFFCFYSTFQGENIFSQFQDSNFVRTTGASAVSPNDYAYSLFLPLALTLAATISSSYSRTRQLFFAGCTAVLAAALIQTYSRSATLALILAGVLMLVTMSNKITGKHLLLLAAGGLLAIFFLPESFTERMASLISITNTQTAGQELSLLRRGNYFVVATNIIERFPLLGAGPGNFPTLHASVQYQNVPFFYGSERMPHSLYLQLATETGIVGLLLFAIPLWKLSCCLFKKTRLADSFTRSAIPAAYMLALLSSLVMGMFLHLLLNKSFWIVLALCTTIYRSCSSPSARQEP